MVGLTGIIMCGGKSTRMGTDKRFLKIGDQLLIFNTLQFLEERCSEILISNNDNKLDFLSYDVIPDQFTSIGPLGGLYTCLNFSTNKLNFVIACDMPNVTGNLLRKLLSVAGNNQAVIPVYNNRPHPLYGLYDKSITPFIKQQIVKKKYSFQNLLKQIDVFYFDADSTDELELININTYSEYLAYEQMARNVSG